MLAKFRSQTARAPQDKHVVIMLSLRGSAGAVCYTLRVRGRANGVCQALYCMHAPQWNH